MVSLSIIYTRIHKKNLQDSTSKNTMSQITQSQKLPGNSVPPPENFIVRLDSLHGLCSGFFEPRGSPSTGTVRQGQHREENRNGNAIVGDVINWLMGRKRRNRRSRARCTRNRKKKKKKKKNKEEKEKRKDEKEKKKDEKKKKKKKKKKERGS